MLLDCKTVLCQYKGKQSAKVHNSHFQMCMSMRCFIHKGSNTESFLGYIIKRYVNHEMHLLNLHYGVKIKKMV